jgi:hypothetical protein
VPLPETHANNRRVATLAARAKQTPEGSASRQSPADRLLPGSGPCAGAGCGGRWRAFRAGASRHACGPCPRVGGRRGGRASQPASHKGGRRRRAAIAGANSGSGRKRLRNWCRAVTGQCAAADSEPNPVSPVGIHAPPASAALVTACRAPRWMGVVGNWTQLAVRPPGRPDRRGGSNSAAVARPAGGSSVTARRGGGAARGGRCGLGCHLARR